MLLATCKSVVRSHINQSQNNKKNVHYQRFTDRKGNYQFS